MNYYVQNINIKIGSIFPNESLNTEFKKFTINKNLPQVSDNKEDFDNFFISGIMTPNIAQIIQEEILEYINFYVPKYASCFFNIGENTAQAHFSHSESFFFIGIDDDGTMTGIPINFSLIDIDNFGRSIINTIKNTILLNIDDNLISKEEIISCIEPYIVVFNKLDKNFIDSISNKNKKEMKTLKIKMEPLLDFINTEREYRNKLKKIVDDITVNNFKKNYFLSRRLMNRVISATDFPILLDIDNSYHTNFLFDIMINFNPNNFDRDYIANIGHKTKIEECFYNDIKKVAIGTYLHEHVKRYTENLKNKVIHSYNLKKKELAEKETEYKSYIEAYNNLHHDLNSHFTEINKHNDYILIKIKFDHKKYHNLMRENPGYINPTQHFLSYKNQKKNDDGSVRNEFIKSQRRLKYIGNKLDPECFKIK